MRRLAALIAALSLLAVAGAAGARGVPPFPRLAGAWSHAEINVTIRHQPHTLILDRGRIVQANLTQITLRRRDQTSVVVPINPNTIVVVDGFAATAGDLRRGMNAETLRIDGGAAVRVRASSI